MTETVQPSGLDARPASTVSVEVRDVDVRYRVFSDQVFGFRDFVSRGFKSRESTEVHAVKGVSFDVAVGEAIGIIGSNGSGKSTLLRAIAGVQAIQNGSVRIRGEAQLLGVSSVLKKHLSGYRNVMLGGLASGLSRAEVEDRMAEIIEFSGLGDAISRPMSTYSSGMRSRLAFSIATLRVPDILLIDEALAVGDKEFREKSLARVDEIRAAAGTVVMVTHNMNEIQKSCSRAIWLERGELRADGDVEEIIRLYEER